MIFRTPLPFREALDSREVRSILPTEFRTRLLAEIPAQIRERAFFSAGVTNAEFLDRANTAIDDLLSGTVDRATKRLELKQLLERLDYAPFAGEEDTLTDLSSDARLNLILDTNLEMAQGYGHFAQGQDPEILDQWPAQELIRVIESEKKRDWPARWAAAGGEFFGSRMIALKGDPIWTNISRFGLPYPPFDFNSGMDVQDIDRDEAVALGLIARDTQIFPQTRRFNEDLQATPQIRSEQLKDALTDVLGDSAQFDAAGVLRWLGGAT
ncbi:MAG: hypothetical protein C0518_05560 [Opitutus sp.]|nr:hypothetical protein [Opitutus sp.]